MKINKKIGTNIKGFRPKKVIYYKHFLSDIVYI